MIRIDMTTKLCKTHNEKRTMHAYVKIELHYHDVKEMHVQKRIQKPESSSTTFYVISVDKASISCRAVLAECRRVGTGPAPILADRTVLARCRASVPGRYRHQSKPGTGPLPGRRRLAVWDSLEHHTPS